MSLVRIQLKKSYPSCEKNHPLDKVISKETIDFQSKQLSELDSDLEGPNFVYPIPFLSCCFWLDHLCDFSKQFSSIIVTIFLGIGALVAAHWERTS